MPEDLTRKLGRLLVRSLEGGESGMVPNPPSAYIIHPLPYLA